jgi:uncharacterized Zn finger protein
MAVFGQLDLWRLAGKRSYERGEQYVDAVGELRDVPDGVAANVQGTELYEVRLTWAAPGLAGECTCPFGEEGEFCKHCVAVGLAVIDAAGDEVDDDDAGGDGDEVRRYLDSLDRAALVELLCTRAAQDADLARALRLRAAAGAG